MLEPADDAGHRQLRYSVRMDWGRQGALAVSRGADVAVIVDVLSFTTAVSVAVDRGAQVFPYRWNDPSARDFARRHDAALAASRPHAAQAGERGQVSLSPVSIMAAAGLSRLVLPSPNGSALAAELAGAGLSVVAACFRNRTAVARWLASQRRHDGNWPVVAVIAAGERWPNGSLRPAVEDFWGAGAVISALAAGAPRPHARHPDAVLSPEAAAAAAAYEAVGADLAAALHGCASGLELSGRGFAEDVTVAAEVDASTAVPVLTSGYFAAVTARPARP